MRAFGFFRASDRFQYQYAKTWRQFGHNFDSEVTKNCFVIDSHNFVVTVFSVLCASASDFSALLCKEFAEEHVEVVDAVFAFDGIAAAVVRR